jgi:flagellar biosynthetic protein FliR
MTDLLNWFVVFTRASALLLAFPLFSTRNVPVVVRVAFAGFLAAFVSPNVNAGLSTDSSLFHFLGCLFKEASVGVFLGFICGIVFHAIEMAGNIVASEVGLNMSSTFNPMMTNVASPPGMMLHWLGVMLMLTLNLHHWVVIGFHRSFALVPVGAAGLSEALLVDGIHRTSSLMATAVQMTAPVMACSFLITTVFSLLGRSVPQMNVFSESFAFRTMAGLGVFGFTCTLAGQHIANHLRRIPEDLQRVCTLLTQH